MKALDDFSFAPGSDCSIVARAFNGLGNIAVSPARALLGGSHVVCSIKKTGDTKDPIETNFNATVAKYSSLEKGIAIVGFPVTIALTLIGLFFKGLAWLSSSTFRKSSEDWTRKNEAKLSTITDQMIKAAGPEHPPIPVTNARQEEALTQNAKLDPNVKKPTEETVDALRAMVGVKLPKTKVTPEEAARTGKEFIERNIDINKRIDPEIQGITEDDLGIEQEEIESEKVASRFLEEAEVDDSDVSDSDLDKKVESAGFTDNVELEDDTTEPVNPEDVVFPIKGDENQAAQHKAPKESPKWKYF